MTEIEKKALALVNEVLAENGMNNTPHSRIPTAVNSLVLLRAIEQHEAFKREVSDAVEKHWGNMPCEFDRFILPKPVDPLVEAIKALQDGRGGPTPESYAACLRNEVEARGYQFTKINEGAKNND